MDVKLVSMIFLALIGAGRSGAAEKIKVDVYLQRDNFQLMGRAEAVASEVFTKLDVRVTWHEGELPATPCVGRRCIGIRMVPSAPASCSPGVLAYARPFGSSGSSITVYEDRLHHLLHGFSGLSNVLLGYVFAHELAHVMLGYDYHSASGVLKAQWKYADYLDMIGHRFRFTSSDGERIRDGLSR
jgi:hypothetical protein